MGFYCLGSLLGPIAMNRLAGSKTVARGETERFGLVVLAGYLIADRGSCVQDCGEGRVAGKDGKCVDCDRPCPKSMNTVSAAIMFLV